MSSDASSPIKVAVGRTGLAPAEADRIAAIVEADARLTRVGDDPDAVVLGPERAAVEVAAETRTVLVVVAEASRAVVADALSAGAHGVIAADELEETLAPALVALRAGLTVVPAADSHPSRKPVLSAREKQILGLVTMGLTNAEIGRRLFLAESTVKYHLLSVYDKLGVRTRKEAADLVVDPRSGLGEGILSITEIERPKGGKGYAKPSVR